MFWWRKVNMSSFEVRIRRRSDRVNVLDCLKSLNEMCFVKFIFILIFLSRKLFRFCSLRILNRLILALFNRDSLDFLLLNKFYFCHKLVYWWCFFSIFLERSWSFIIRAFIRNVYNCVLCFFDLIVIERRSLFLLRRGF